MKAPTAKEGIMFMKSKTILLTIFLCGSILTSCSFRRLAIQNIHWLLMYQLDSMFDTTQKQEEFLKPKINEIVKWIKNTKVEKLISILIELRKRVLNGVTETDRDWFNNQVDQLTIGLMLKASDVAAAFLATLNSEQTEYFAGYLEERNERFIKYVQSSKIEYQEQIKERFEYRFERLEKYFNYLTEKQKSVLYSATTFDQNKDQKNYKHRLETQNIWISLFKTNDQEKIKNFIVQWAKNRTAGRSEEYMQYYRDWKKKRFSDLILISPMLEQEQKLNFEIFIDELIKDLKSFK